MCFPAKPFHFDICNPGGFLNMPGLQHVFLTRGGGLHQNRQVLRMLSTKRSLPGRYAGSCASGKGVS